MNVKELIDQYHLEVAGGHSGLDHDIKGGYCGDLLSDVMGKAPDGCVWLTVQGHHNIVAIAVLKDMAAIIIAGGHAPDPETIQKADAENIPILLWPHAIYDLVGRLYESGIQNQNADPG
jgi:predicted transcriptional regulator